MEPRCQIRTDSSGLQIRRIAIYAYSARDSGANGANRTLIGCLPSNCSPTELHRLGARGGIRNPGLRVTNAALFHLSYSGLERARRIELRWPDRRSDAQPIGHARETLERTEIIEISSPGWRPGAHPIYHARLILIQLSKTKDSQTHL